ncbi:MAG: FHA domain-containing protein [Paludibacteraceae bacterium]|nr:FHA domain-containing protein [Paludibacteraceae bacterium]
MRCKNCGWDNPAGLTKCEKCNTPLEGDVSNQPAASYNGTACESNYADTVTEGSNAAPVYGKTVCESNAFSGVSTPVTNSTPSTSAAGVLDRCPECGYPLRPGTSVCPKCHHMLELAATELEDSCGTSFEHAMPSKPGKKQEVAPTRFDGTVMPGMNMTPDIWFSLTPIAHQGERETPQKVEFEDRHVELNRDNIDPKNHTITSKVQAVVDYDSKKNRWYIQDKSSQRYTFVRCTDEMPLMDGDEILMGDRRFIFHAEKAQVAPQQMDFMGTIAVGRQRANAPKCTLTPIVDEDEQDAPVMQTYRGDVHQLNRANLDPENHTITSKVQAILNFEDGNWYIKDESSLKTTYLYCADAIDLKDGDMILMGNRTFIFNC